MNLTDFLSELDISDFFSKYWGSTYYIGRGGNNKFDNLITWEEYNKILSLNRLEYPRVRIAKDGEVLSPELYMSIRSSGSDTFISNLVHFKVYQLLREGATLIIDSIDEMNYNVRNLAEEFECKFRERVQVNSYLSWGTTKGFNTHWDEHDVFVVQVKGRKYWKIYGSTKKLPMRHEDEDEDLAPDKTIWEGELNEGDFIYIPKGCWHSAEALGELTLHLTFGVNHKTGIDFLNSVIDNLKANEKLRSYIPHYSQEKVDSWVSEILLEVSSRLTSEEIGKYVDKKEGSSFVRPHFCLPFVIDLSESFETCKSIKYLANRIGKKVTEGEFIKFNANGKEWVFAKSCQKVLTFLEENRLVSYNDLVAISQEENINKNTLDNFIIELTIGGLLFLEK